MQRRDFLIGGGCLIGAAASESLRPRRRVTLIGSAKLDEITPRRFGDWNEIHVGQVIQPRTEGTLAAELYSQMLGRVYANSGGDFVMLALAYGDTQSDLLQLHRPETCYPAFGFAITRSMTDLLDVGPARVPTRTLVASAPDRLENITYWTRIGEYLPTSQGEQREDKLKIAIHGILPDGILVRASSIGDNSAASFELNRKFLKDLVLSIEPRYLPVFIGQRLTGLLQRASRAWL